MPRLNISHLGPPLMSAEIRTPLLDIPSVRAYSARDLRRRKGTYQYENMSNSGLVDPIRGE